MGIARALISVADKTGVADFARALSRRKVEILSTGGTEKALRAAGVPVTAVESVVGFPHLLGGRVKTLAPQVHAAILADRSDPRHRADLEAAGIRPIDLVAVNLYPFEKAMADDADLAARIEEIDIGGVALLRAAAKNHAHVTVVSSPDQYTPVLGEIQSKGDTDPVTRRRLAYTAFCHTTQYDALVSDGLAESFFRSGEPLPLFPPALPLPLGLRSELRYGENHHQRAAVYADLSPVGRRTTGLLNAHVLHGKALSYNNLLDGEEAVSTVREFDEPTLVIIKHATPSGVASAPDLHTAWEGAYNTDTYSPFGGIIAVNRTLDGATAAEMAKIFLELVLAPAFSPEALQILTRKQNLRVVEVPGLDRPFSADDLAKRGPRLAYRSITGGLLVQEQDLRPFTPAEWKTVTRRKPTAAERETMLFAARVVKHVRSNAVVFAKGTRTVGIGGGQTARVDASWIACHKGGSNIEGSVMASDAFFPFRDAIDVAAGAGVTAIVQPGGSIRDDEVVAAADEHGIAMVTTGHRLFHH